MKSNSKKRVWIILLALLIISSSVSYGADTNKGPKIESRSLVFNSGLASDQIRLLKDFFRARQQSNVPWGYEYDARTKELVREYQEIKGLKADGIAGSATLKAINDEIKERSFRLGLRVPVLNRKGDIILINKSSNTLYFMRDGAILKSYPVATGKTTELTPSGQFKIVVKFKDPAWGGAGISDPIPGGDPTNPLGTRWIGISYGGGGKYGVHGNSNPRSIGTYASLGCVRMFNSDVEELFENVKINTPIWMGSESLLESYGVKFEHKYLQHPIVEKPKEDKLPEIKVSINGKNLDLANPVINKNGTTYHPFREILEGIGAEVIWDGLNRKVTGILGEKYVQFQIDNPEYLDVLGYKYLPKGKEPFIRSGNTYVPIRNLMESLGFKVSWEPIKRIVVIESIVEEIQEEDEYFQSPIEEETPIEENPIEEIPIDEESKGLGQEEGSGEEGTQQGQVENLE